MFITAYGNVPGMDNPQYVYANQFAWGQRAEALILGMPIDKDTVDTGTPTDRLLPGLILGKLTSSGKLSNFGDTKTTGAQNAVGVLMVGLRMEDYWSGTNRDKVYGVMVGGPVQAAKLRGLTQKARGDMFGRFVFDDDVIGNKNPWKDVVAKTADYTVTAADNNTIFTNQGAVGAVVFTLPTIAKGLRYRFFVEADQNVTVASVVSDTLVVFNDAAADSIAFSTSSEKIGGSIEVIANADATKWLVFVNLGAETQTPTIVTA